MIRFLILISLLASVVFIGGRMLWATVNPGNGKANASALAESFGFDGPGSNQSSPSNDRASQAPENLTRLREEKERRRLQAKLDILLPAAQRLVEAHQLYDMEMEVWSEMRQQVEASAGYLGAIGAPPLQVQEPQTASLLMSIQQAELAYDRVRPTYISKLKEIDQWFFERTRGVRRGKAKEKEYSVLEPAHHQDEIIRRAEHLLQAR